MRNPVAIILHGVPRSDALERYIAERVQVLQQQCPRIQACHVVVDALHRHEREAAQYAVRLNIELPGTEIAVNREHAEDVYIALRDAFAAAGLQLSDHLRRQSKAGHGLR